MLCFCVPHYTFLTLPFNQEILNRYFLQVLMVIHFSYNIVIYFCLFSATRVEVCSLLLAHGADPTLLNCHSKAAVDAAPTKELQDKLSCMFSFLFDLFLLSQPNIRCNV